MEKVILALKIAGGAYAIALVVASLVGVIVVIMSKVVSNRQEGGETV